MIRQECNICNIPIERAEGKMLICWPESQIFMSHPDAEIANSDIYGSAAYWVPEEVVTGEISEMQKETLDFVHTFDTRMLPTPIIPYLLTCCVPLFSIFFAFVAAGQAEAC